MDEPYSDEDRRKDLIETSEAIRASSKELVAEMHRLLEKLKANRRTKDS